VRTNYTVRDSKNIIACVVQHIEFFSDVTCYTAVLHCAILFKAFWFPDKSQADNGDIAIQWEWSNFDPSQSPNPLTDYDKTLYNWFRPRNEHVIKKLCQSVVRERLAEYVKYTTIFSRARLLKWLLDGFWPWLKKTRHHARMCLLGVWTMASHI